jgi:uncharacterized protein
VPKVSARLGWVCLAALLTPVLCFSACTSPPNSKACAIALTGRVVDQAGILSTSSEAALNAQLASLEQRSSDQLVVVTTNSLNGYELEDYSLELSRCWSVGHEGVDNGIVVLIAPTQRKARIEVGRGLEDFVKDEEAKVIMNTAMVPAFKNGDYEGGMQAGVAAIIRELTGDSTAAAARYAATHLKGQKR